MTKAKKYLTKWIQFEIDKPSIKALEPERRAMETAYDRLTELDHLVCDLSDDELELAKKYEKQIITAKDNQEELKLILQGLNEIA